MPVRRSARAQRVPVLEVPPMPTHYADAFTVSVPAPDHRTAEAWARCGLEEAPAVVRRLIRTAHRRVLGLRLLPDTAPDQILGWHIVDVTADVVVLAATSSTLRAVIVVRRPDQHTATLTTLLHYDRRRTGRALWTLVGPVHRRLAPLLLARAARSR